MVARLLEARNKKEENVGDAEEPSSSPASSSADSPFSEGSNDTEFDEETELKKNRSMRVKELRAELKRRRIPRAGLFDEEDLVQALSKAKQLDAVFSATGNI